MSRKSSVKVTIVGEEYTIRAMSPPSIRAPLRSTSTR